MSGHDDTTKQPSWQPDQMATDDEGPAPDADTPDEIEGGLRGGGGPTWNKGSMEIDEQQRVDPSSMKESQQGPWGSADAAERAEREKSDPDR
jgi:hypothetical protein